VTYPGQKPVSNRCRYTLSLSVSHLVSDDGIFSWRNHLEQVADWADTLIVDVGSAGSDGTLSASVAWNSAVAGSPDQWDPITQGVANEQQRIEASMAGDQGSFTIPLPAVATPILGAEAKLRLTLQRRAEA
jgi:hypothetical protein